MARTWLRNRPGRSRPKANRAPSERRILFGDCFEIGQRLVAADIERAEGHRLRSGRVEHGAIERELLFGLGKRSTDHELQFGAEKSDARAGGVFDVRQVDHQAGVDHEIDRLAVLGDARLVAQRAILRLAAGAEAHALGEGRLHFGRGAHIDFAGNAVDDDGVAGFGEARRIGDLADGGDAERAGDDGDVRVRSAFFEHQTAQALAVVVEQRGRTHGARDENGVFRQLLARRRVIVTHQLAHQAMAEIVEIVQALAQIRIGGAQHARARVRLHALDRGFGGEAGGDRLAQLVLPAMVVGEHAIGFEHVAMFAALGHIAALQHAVEIGAQLYQRGLEPLEFARHVVGDVVGDDDARLVQHHMAHGDAVGERRALDMLRVSRRRFGAGLGERGQFARGDHLGEHHRRGLQRLDLFLGIGAVRAVLHHEHAERVAGAQDRHAQEGVVDFFAGFRAVGEGRVALRVGEVQRGRFAGDKADEALMGAQDGQMDGVALQTFGGIEFEGVVDAQHIDRADLGHHVGRDHHHDLVETLLRADGLRHHFAEPSQQDAGASQRSAHRLPSSGLGPGRRLRS